MTHAKPYRRGGGVTAAVLFAVTWAGPVAAQAGDPIGALTRPMAAEVPTRTLSAYDRGRATAIAYARCMDRAQPAVLAELLAEPVRPANAERSRRRLAYAECLDAGELHMDRGSLRAAVYIIRYRQAFAGAAPAASPTPVDYAADVAGDTTPEARTHVELRQFATCVARADPAASRALVLAPVAGAAENAAFAALAPHLSDCLAPGQTVSFGKGVLAGLIAEVLYRGAAPKG